MTTNASRRDFAPEHQIFWMLVKKSAKREDVARAYLAIQAALAYGHESVDAGWLSGAMMGEGRSTMGADHDPVGADGLAYFYWLYEIELISVGETDAHQYHFSRRHDGANILVHLKTAPAPRSLQFQQTYERARRKLEAKRAALLPTYHWYTTAQLFDLYVSNGPTLPP